MPFRKSTFEGPQTGEVAERVVQMKGKTWLKSLDEIANKEEATGIDNAPPISSVASLAAGSCFYGRERLHR